MNIVIPEILSGGKGREMQRSAREIGDAVARGAQAVQNIYDQAGYIEAKKLDNDMNVELNVLYGKEAAATDGTNPNLTAEVRAKADSIYNKYAAQTNNATAKEKLKYAYEARVANYSQSLDSHNIKMLWQTTMDGVKIKVAESVRMAGQNGDLTGGEEAIRKDLETQRNFFGGRYDAVSRTAMSLYYSNAIPASLSNPQTRGATLAQLKDDGYRERYYKHLSPDQVAEMERMRASAGEESVRQDAYFQLHSKYGGNLEAMDRALDNPKTMSSLGITIEDAAYIKGFIGRSIETKERAQKMRWDRTANQVFLNLHQMSPAQIDEYVQRGDLSWQLGEQFKKDLKAVQDAPTNPQTYMRIYTQIKESVGDSDALTKTRLEIYSSTGLSWMDKKTLLNMTGEQEGKLEAHLANQGAEYIKRVLMPTMSVGGLTKPEESKQLLDAMAAYEAGFQRLKKSGKPLTADAVNQLAKDVANAYVLSPTELVQRSIQRMNEQKEKAPGKKDKHGYVPGEKKVINGATYEYIGNDQWQKL